MREKSNYTIIAITRIILRMLYTRLLRDFVKGNLYKIKKTNKYFYQKAFRNMYIKKIATVINDSDTRPHNILYNLLLKLYRYLKMFLIDRLKCL